MHYRILVTAILTLILAAGIVALPIASAGETEDRRVDRAALETQTKAIVKLKKLAKRTYGNGDQEPAVLIRLAESQKEAASIEFRLSQGQNARQKKQLSELITTLDRLIARYADSEYIDHGLFMRAQALEELDLKLRAKVDYERLVETFPLSTWAVQSHMSLADMAIEAADHNRAIAHLREVEKYPGDAHYPFALYKLSWAHYNLKLFTVALSYLERNIRYYDTRAKKGADSELVFSPSDEAIRETSLFDSVMFYAEGIDSKSEDFSVEGAYDRFRALEKNGSHKNGVLGKMFVRFAKLMRSQRHEPEMIQWSKLMIRKEDKRPETLEIVLTVLEHEFNQRRFKEMGSTARDLVELCTRELDFFKKTNSYTVVTAALGDTAEKLRGMTIKNKQADEVELLNSALGEIYASLIRILETGDPRIARIHYNLAETLFELGKFKESTQHYRWVVENRAAIKDIKAGEIELRAAASRYEELRLEKKIPGQLKAVPMASNKVEPLNGATAEWISWLDTYANRKHPLNDTFDGLLFEAIRTLYQERRLADATSRLEELSRARPASKFAVPAATLLLDTYVVSSDWAKVIEYSELLLKNESWKKNAFAENLRRASADASFKILESAYQAKEYSRVSKLARDLEKRHSDSPRVGDAMYLWAQSAQAEGDREKATELFGKILGSSKTADAQTKTTALIARAQLLESAYDYAGALEDIEALMKSDATTDARKAELQKKRIYLSWISGRGLPECKQKDQESLAEQIRLECQKQKALAAAILEPKVDPDTEVEAETRKEWIKAAVEAPKPIRTLAALEVLAKFRLLEFRERFVMIRIAAQNWDELDALTQLRVLPVMNRRFTQTFTHNREELSKVVPLKKASPNAIARRMEWIREFELTATKVSQLPWTGLRASFLAEMARIYVEFTKTLRELPLPTDIPENAVQEYQKALVEVVGPFEGKAKELGDRAFDLASKHGVEPEILDPITKEFATASRKPAAAHGELDLDALVDQFGDLRFTRPGKSARAGTLGKLWADAWAAQDWARVAFATQELGRTQQITAPSRKALQSWLLWNIGARAEARVEWENARQDQLKEQQASLAQAGGSK